MEFIENSILIEKEVINDSIDNNSSWLSIIYNSLQALEGVASLSDLYDEVYKLISVKYTEKLTNKDIKATIRGVLQRYCSGSTSYNNRLDLFENVDTGCWALKKDK